MKQKLEKYLVEIMKGKRTGFFSFLIKIVLLLLSVPYSIAMKLRTSAYDNRWFKQYTPPIPVVISIGNIVAGGTGKTPLTLMLAGEFYDKAMIGVLSRGYRSLAEKLPAPVTVCAGKGPLHSAAYCGDEPYLIAQNLPKSFIYVGRDRHKSANLASKAGVELAILDDAMQHRRIARDYEVVILDVDDPFGQNHYLPRGFLRESPLSLSRADLIAINHVKDKESFEKCEKMVHPYTKAPIIGTQLELQQICDLQGNPQGSIRDKRVALFCGIGQPDRFIQTLKECGVYLVGQEIFPDHAVYYVDQIIKLAEKYKSQGVEMLVCTEKDRVKIPEIPHLPLPIIWLKMRLKIVENKELWENFVGKVKKDLDNRI